MANGQQPVDDKTMRQMVGKRMMFGGLGQVFGSHASAPQAAAIQAGYNRMGEVAAENMRQRFYKNEWDQVRETRIKPELDKLHRAQARWKMVMTPANTDYVRTAGRDEAANMTDESMSETKVQAQQSQNQMQDQANPGPEGPDSIKSGGLTQGQNEQAQTQRQRSGNPAMAIAGQVGVQVHSQEMTIPDPRTGARVLINSPEGMALYQEASSDFWSVNSEVQQELMTIGSEYSLNPFAQAFLQKMMQNATNQAGHGVTGKLDPLQAQQTMDELTRSRDERETHALSQETGRFELDAARAAQGDIAAFNRRKYGLGGPVGSQPGGGGPVGSQPGGIGEYAGRGTLPAGATDAEAAAFGGAYQKNLELMRSEAGAEGETWIPESHLEPGNEYLIIGDLRTNDPLFQADLEQVLFKYTSGIYDEMRLDPGAWLKDNPGVSTKVRDLILTGGISDPEVTQYIEQMVQATPAYKQAITDVSYNRLKALVRESPDRVKPALLRYAQDKVDAIDSPKRRDTSDFHDLQRRLEADPMWVAAMFMNSGIKPSGSTSDYRKLAVRATTRKLAGKPSRTPLASYESRAPKPTGPLAPRVTVESDSSQMSAAEINAAVASVPEGPAKRYKAPKTRQQRREARRRREYEEHGLGPRAGRAAAQVTEDVKDTVKGALIELNESLPSPGHPVQRPPLPPDSIDFLSMIQKRRQGRAKRAKDTVGSRALATRALSSRSDGTIGEN